MTHGSTPGVAFDERLGYRRLDPLPEPSEVERFYESHYRDNLQAEQRAPDIASVLAGGLDADRELAWQGATIYADVLDILARFVPPEAGRRVIDIGAGPGSLVLALGEGGWDAQGTEPSVALSEAARERGADVAAASAADRAEQWARDGEPPFAAATMVNVLEHVRDPEAVLDSIHDMLAPGGVLVVRVPNDFNALQAAAVAATGLDPWWVVTPDHLNYFDHETLRSFVASRGFEPLEQTADFPMELFLLMGDVYVGDSAVGSVCHERRRRLELALDPEIRRSMGRAWAAAGIGRNAMLAARRSP